MAAGRGDQRGPPEWRRATRHRRLTGKLGPAPDVRDHSDGVVPPSTAGAACTRARRDPEVPAGQRDAVALCLVAEVDTARALGVTEATVRSRIHRARIRLRTMLPEETS